MLKLAHFVQDLRKMFCSTRQKIMDFKSEEIVKHRKNWTRFTLYSFLQFIAEISISIFNYQLSLECDTFTKKIKNENKVYSNANSFKHQRK